MILRISEAPSLSDLRKRAENAKRPLKEIITEEKAKKYQAIRYDNGRPTAKVLIMNPAIFDYELTDLRAQSIAQPRSEVIESQISDPTKSEWLK